MPSDLDIFRPFGPHCRRNTVKAPRSCRRTSSPCARPRRRGCRAPFPSPACENLARSAVSLLPEGGERPETGENQVSSTSSWYSTTCSPCGLGLAVPPPRCARRRRRRGALSRAAPPRPTPPGSRERTTRGSCAPTTAVARRTSRGCRSATPYRSSRSATDDRGSVSTASARPAIVSIFTNHCSDTRGSITSPPYPGHAVR